MAKLIPGQFSMFPLMTSGASPSATSSPGLVGGPTLDASPGGPTTGPCGPEAPPASPSAPPVSKRARRTSVTSGPSSLASLEPVGPLLSWENKLRQRLARIGSTECLLTWKASATPAGRSLFRLVPSMRPIEEIACGLWRTPATTEPGVSQERLLNADGTPWTPGQRAYDRETGRLCQVGLSHEARAMWPTPVHTDHKNQFTVRKGRSANGDYLRIAVKAMWPTPVKSDGTGGPRPPDAKRGPMPGLKAAAAGMWPTPTTTDASRGVGTIRPHDTGIPLPQRVAQVIGTHTSGPSDPTAKPGALAPTFVAWLMGFPPEWMDCAPDVMPKQKKR